MPSQFLKTLKEHKENGGLTFHNIHSFGVGMHVYSGRLEVLVRNHYVHVDCVEIEHDESVPGKVTLLKKGKDETVPTIGEIVKEMKRRLEYIPEYDKIALKKEHKDFYSHKKRF